MYNRYIFACNDVSLFTKFSRRAITRVMYRYRRNLSALPSYYALIADLQARRRELLFHNDVKTDKLRASCTVIDFERYESLFPVCSDSDKLQRLDKHLHYIIRFDDVSSFTSATQRMRETKYSGTFSVIRSERIAIAVKRKRSNGEREKARRHGTACNEETCNITSNN